MRLSFRLRLLLLSIVPPLVLGLAFGVILRGMQDRALEESLRERARGLGTLWNTLVDARGKEVDTLSDMMRSQKKLLGLLKQGDPAAIAVEASSVWNQIQGKVEVMFFYNSGLGEKSVMYALGMENLPSGRYTVPLLDWVDRERQARYGLERFPDGRIRLMQARAYFNRPKAPYNLAVLGLDAGKLAAELVRVGGVMSAELRDGPAPAGQGLQVDRQTRQALHRVDVTDAGGVVLAHLELRENIADILAYNQSAMRTLWLLGAGVLVLSFAVSWWSVARIMRRFQALTGLLGEVARGQVTPRAPVPLHPDEVDRIALGINAMLDSLTATIRAIELQAFSVSAATGELLRVNLSLGDKANRSRDQALTIQASNQRIHDRNQRLIGNIREVAEHVQGLSGAAARVADHIQRIADAAQLASGNVNTVAAAAEQMTANIAGVNDSLAVVNNSVTSVSTALVSMERTIVQVRRRCEEAAGDSRQAESNALSTRQIMERLTDSAREIEGVVEVINAIAEQTNMLALNASIEAAGAGDSGKGFAVVANEVKDLARQTAGATDNIATRIHAIQSSSRQASDASAGVSRSIESIKDANQNILESVSELYGSMKDISQAMGGVSRASTEVVNRAQEMEQAAQEVTRSMAESARGTQEIADSSGRASLDAVQMSAASHDAGRRTAEVSDLAGEIVEAVGEARRLTDTMGGNVSVMHGVVEHSGRLARMFAGIREDLVASTRGMEIGPSPLPVQECKEDILERLGRLATWCAGGREGVVLEQLEQTRLGQWLAAEGATAAGLEDVRTRLEQWQQRITQCRIHLGVAAPEAAGDPNRRDMMKDGMANLEGATLALFQALDAWYQNLKSA
ncbi:MAG: methyl-accepting chemotaxis protein [Magnetococcus sp. WYHC-3]